MFWNIFLYKFLSRFIGTTMEDNAVNIFMEYVPGGSLALVLKRFVSTFVSTFCDLQCLFPFNFYLYMLVLFVNKEIVSRKRHFYRYMVVFHFSFSTEIDQRYNIYWVQALNRMLSFVLNFCKICSDFSISSSRNFILMQYFLI